MLRVMTEKQSEARVLDWLSLGDEARQERCENLSIGAKQRYEDPIERLLASKRAKAQHANPEKRAKYEDGMRLKGLRERGSDKGARGLSRSPEYGVWRAMNYRCHNPKASWYKNYGGRGIRVCDEWRGRGGFARFYEHVGPRPSPDHSLDRIDNDGNYKPGNVRWVLRTTQSKNSRKVRMITIGGETKHLAEWARQIGVSSPTLAYRIKHWPESRWLEPV